MTPRAEQSAAGVSAWFGRMQLGTPIDAYLMACLWLIIFTQDLRADSGLFWVIGDGVMIFVCVLMGICRWKGKP